jgi:hypothetical protein
MNETTDSDRCGRLHASEQRMTEVNRRSLDAPVQACPSGSG